MESFHDPASNDDFDDACDLDALLHLSRRGQWTSRPRRMLRIVQDSTSFQPFSSGELYGTKSRQRWIGTRPTPKLFKSGRISTIEHAPTTSI
jgi:hypothetical protein